MGISDGDDPLNQKEMLEELMGNCKVISKILSLWLVKT